MTNGKRLLLFIVIIAQTVSQDTRSIRLSRANDVKYQCNNVGCLSSTIVSVSSLRRCEMVCLSNSECRTVTFDSYTKQCEMFPDILCQFGNLSVQLGAVTMTALDYRRLSARK